MLTWLRLWPFLALPAFLMILLASIPTFEINAHLFGGGVIREWYVTHLFTPVLPHALSERVAAWFDTATPLQEWYLAAWIAININALMLPFLFAIGEGVLFVSAWHAKKDLALKKDAMR